MGVGGQKMDVLMHHLDEFVFKIGAPLIAGQSIGEFDFLGLDIFPVRNRRRLLHMRIGVK